jgi:oxygen-independent coproporphyrinogen-3 oxidase
MGPQAVYIHIPFCAHKCHYCDFTAYLVDGQPVDAYLQALEQEMAQWTDQVSPGEVRSIYIGGGTPTILSPQQMEQLLANIRRFFPQWSKEIEFTVEANPETVRRPLLEVLYAGGVNRLSFGAQTFRPHLLQQIGRAHGVKEIIEAFAMAREVGFRNLSLDLMFGLPHQRVADMQHALEETMALHPEHLSCYSLKIEEGTPFYQWEKQGRLPLPTEDEEFSMYQLTRQFLAEQGYQQYEISNFSLPGRESEHNSAYWRNDAYYGFGAGAHGYVQGQRHANVKSIREYMTHCERGQLPISEQYTVSHQEQMENFMILGLRLMRGVSRAVFSQRYQQSLDQVFGDVIDRLLEKELLASEDDRLYLTEKGILFGNEVFASFLS